MSGSKVIKVIGAFLSREKAVEAIADTTPDVVIVDLGLPDTSGIEVIKKIKRFLHLKKIYKKLHAHSMPDAIARAKDKGLIQSDY